MDIYNIRTTSWPLWILTLLLSLLAFVFLPSLWMKTGLGHFVLIIIAVQGSFYLQRFTSRGEVRITLSETAIAIKYIKQPIFSKKRDCIIPLTEIESYKYEPDRTFDLFKLTLRDYREFHFYHYTFFPGMISTSWLLTFLIILKPIIGFNPKQFRIHPKNRINPLRSLERKQFSKDLRHFI